MGCNRYHKCQTPEISETSAVIFFGFFNFFFLIDLLDGKGRVDMAHLSHANGCIFGGDVGK